MSTYALVLILTVFFPVVLSFDRKVHFISGWPTAVLASLCVGLPFVVWDMVAAGRGDWGFSPVHTWSPRLGGLPLEEIFFFILAPFACVFVYECVKGWTKERVFKTRKWPFHVAALAAFVSAVFAYPRFYTCTILVFVALFLEFSIFFGKRYLASRHFWVSQALCLLPFLVVNGVLTALPIVSYSSSAILGVRAVTIPVEDFAYNFVLVGANIMLASYLREKLRKRKLG